MINLIVLSLFISTFFLICKLISVTKIYAQLRMQMSTIRRALGISGFFFMRKYSLIYRIILELILIWFIFEWNDKFVINKIVSWINQISITLTPYLYKLRSFALWASPYGRLTLNHESITIWLNRLSLALVVVYVLNAIVILLSVDQKLSKLAVSSFGFFIFWYLLLFLSWIISIAPFQYIPVQWALAIIGFFLLTILFFGIIYGLIFD